MAGNNGIQPYQLELMAFAETDRLSKPFKRVPKKLQVFVKVGTMSVFSLEHMPK